MKSASGAHIGIGGFIKKLPIIASALVFIADIIFGFFWVKGFYYCGKVIAWICVATLALLLLSKLTKLKFWGRLKKAFTDDDEATTATTATASTTPATTATTATAPTTPATTSTPASKPTTSTAMTKEEYEKATKALLTRYEAAVKAGDSALEKEIEAEMQELKKRAPKAPSKEDVEKKMAAAQKLLNN